MEETKKKLYVERDGFWTESAMVFTALAMVFRLIGSIGRWNDLQYLTIQVALPIFCGLLFVLCLLLFGKRAFWTTVLPVVIGVVFFIFRAMSMENEWLRGCWIIVYLVFTVLYTMAFSCPRLKWALVLLLLAVFAYHIGVQDLPKLMDLEHPVSFVDGMEEMSILGIVLAMLFVSLAMRSAPKAQKAETGTLPETEVQPEIELQPETQPWAEPEEEPHPEEQPEEKKLSHRERSRRRSSSRRISLPLCWRWSRPLTRRPLTRCSPKRPPPRPGSRRFPRSPPGSRRSPGKAFGSSRSRPGRKRALPRRPLRRRSRWRS